MTIEQILRKVLTQLNTIIVGKELQIKYSVACLLSNGHLLIEDVPGVGKTTLSHALAHTFGLNYSRVQFTSDLMPSDLTGVSIFNRQSQSFDFHPGPLFSEVLLADEINRASPKTQSALLEAMEEHQVSVEGQTRALPQPFFVIATQNSHDQIGTYALPESQLDRFLMRISMGYPDAVAERKLLTGEVDRGQIQYLPQIINSKALVLLQNTVLQVHTSEALLDYLQTIIKVTRNGQWFAQGISPRAAIATLRVAKAWALLHGRNYVAPDDIQATLPHAIAHRLIPVKTAQRGAVAQVQAMIDSIALP